MAEEHAHDKEDTEHVVSPAIYIAVLLALMFLMVVTIAAAFVDLDSKLHGGYWNMTIAVLIAMTKAVLIILFFMHVKYGSRVTWAFAGAAFVWLGIFLTLSLSDYFTRPLPLNPMSHPEQASPQMERPAPRPDSVVGDAGAAARPLVNGPAIARGDRRD